MPLNCTKYNKINIRFLNELKYSYNENAMNSTDILRTGLHKRLNMHYKLLLEISGNTFSGML